MVMKNSIEEILRKKQRERHSKRKSGMVLGVGGSVHVSRDGSILISVEAQRLAVYKQHFNSP